MSIYLHVTALAMIKPRLFLGLNMRSAGDVNEIPILDNFEEVADEQFLEEPIPEPNPVVEPEPVEPAPEVHDASELLETGNAEGKEDVFSHYWHPETY